MDRLSHKEQFKVVLFLLLALLQTHFAEMF
jgi:hypothetical protein